MRLYILLALAISVALIGCESKEQPPAGRAATRQAGDAAAGKAWAERECKGCHGLDGKGIAPAIPHLAAQQESYLLAALQAYKEGKRSHAALKDLMANMSEADLRNVAAYYAGLPPVTSAAAKDAQPAVLPYEKGKALAAPCAKCHGEDGNSKTPGVPSLAGQQPRYFVVAIQEYLHKDRQKAPMHAMLPGLSKPDMESLALYFASQTPAERPAPPFGDPAAGEPLTAVCGGCHGVRGVSSDAATPTLAGQDAQYLVDAIKAYRTSRKRESMRVYVTGLSDKDIENIAAFYSVQKSKPAEKGQTIVQDLTEKCNRCHGSDKDSPAPDVPKIRGQDRDYLIMALRAYRDDKRESSTMHKMSLPYSDSIIESVASFYANQPAK
ncbi:MAG: c-type cytochrome [Burkholderiales bacterium]